MKSLYEKAVETLPAKDIDHHASDLYLRKSAESSTLIDAYEFKSHVQTFKSNIDGAVLYDVPFAYNPFWKNGE